MARGYLGKISAIVSANTGNYVRGLDESAKKTAAFAKTIQSDLSRASREASKSIDSILTPLQRVERAIQNARAQRLSFRGFDGAIRTVEDLRKRIGSLDFNDKQLAVRVSGLNSLNALNNAIEGIKQEDIDLAVRVGGVDGLRRLREQVQEVNGTLINVDTRRSAENLDFLIEKFQTLSAQRIQQVQIAVETAQLDRAEAAFKRTVSVAQQIAAPLGAAVQQVSQLSAEIQTAFGPALQAAQRAVGNLNRTIESGGRLTDNTFERTAARVEQTTQAIRRLSEASRTASSAATGVELGFAAPGVQRELTASAAARNAAAGVVDPSRFAPQVQQLAQLNDLIVQYQTEVEKNRLLGLDTTQAQGRLDKILLTTQRARESLEGQLKVDADTAAAEAAFKRLQGLSAGFRDDIAFKVTGDFQSAEQAETAIRRLVGELSKLDATQIQALAPQFDRLFAAINTNDLGRVREEFNRTKAALEREVRIKVDSDAAVARFNEFQKVVSGFRDNLEFKVSGDFQNVNQATDAIRGLVEQAGRLDASQLEPLRSSFERLFATVRSGNLRAAIEILGVENVSQAAARLGDLIALDERTINTRLEVAGFGTTEQAKVALDEVAARSGRQVETVLRVLNVGTVAEAESRLASLDARDGVEVEARLRADGVDGLLAASRAIDDFTGRNNAQVRAAISVTGAADVSEAIRRFDLLASLDGRRIRAELQAVGIGSLEQAQRIVAELSQRPDAQVDAVFRVLGVDSVDDANRRLGQLVASGGQTIEAQLRAAGFDSLEEARGEFERLSLLSDEELRVIFNTEDLQALRDSFSRTKATLEEQIRVKADTDAATASLRTFEASAKAVSESLNFQATGNFQTIEQARTSILALRSELENLRPDQIASLLPGFDSLVAKTVSGKASLAELQTAFDALRRTLAAQLEIKLDDDDASRKLTDLIDKAEDLAIALSREISLKIDGPQSIEQLQSAASGLVGELDKLDAAQKAVARPRLEALAAAIETNDINRIRVAFDQAKEAIEQGIVATVDTRAAEDRVKALDALLDQVFGADNISNINALQQSIERLSLANQLNLGDAVEEFRDAIASGKDYEEQLKRLLAIQERLSVAQAIETLPEGSDARRRLQERFDREGAGPPPPGAPPLPTDIASAQQRTDLFGLPIDDSVRRLGVLQGSLNSVKGQVDQLPIPLQARFVPLLAEAEAEMKRLVASGTATESQLAAAAARVDQLATGARRAADSVSLLSAGDALERIATREAVGQLDAAARVLAEIGAQAGGPAAQAYDRLRAAQQRFISEGTSGTPAARREIRALQEELASAAEATGRISFSRALREIQRGGDIARGSFGSAGLAIQQAAFALDDFFSVSGGLDQRIRAAGNNISQLGFIIGSTQGLIAGIGISIGAQLIAALIKLSPIVRDSEAQQKRFAAEISNANSALERQQQIAEKLAAAYRQVGDSIAQSGLSDEAQRIASRQDRIREIGDTQRELRGVTAERSSTVLARLSATRSGFEQRLRDATDPAVASTYRDAIQSVQRDITSFINDVERRATLETDRARAAGGNADQTLARDFDAARRRRDSLQGLQERFGGAGVNQAIDRLVDQADRVAAALAVARQRLAEDAATQRIAVAEATGDALGRVQSIASGLSGITDFSQRASESSLRLRELLRDSSTRPVDDLIAQLGRFASRLEEAAVSTGAFASSLDSAAGDLARTVEAELISRGDQARRDANRSEAQFGANDPRTLILRRSQQAIQDATRSQETRRIAIEEEIARRRSSFESAAFAGFGRGPGGQEAVDIARQIQSLRAVAADATRSAESRRIAAIEADELQGRLARIFDALPEVAALRRRADEGDVEAQRRIRQLESASRGAELAAPPARRFAEELADGITAIRDFYAQLAQATGGVVDFAGQAAAIGRFIGQQGQIDSLRTPAERVGIQLQQEFANIDAAVQGLQGIVDPRELTRRRQAARGQAIARVSDLGLTEQQRAQLAIAEEFGKIQAQAAKLVQGGDLAGAEQLVLTAGRNGARQFAPAFAALSDEVANAVLQGPSRAALQVADASTTEGQRELNRLLRGDDPARDANLLELQKQTPFLEVIANVVQNTLQRLGLANN